jgi:phosphate transport system substrate-binding protein
MHVVRLSLGLLLLAAPVHAELRIVGSDLLGPGLVPALENYARRSDVRLTSAFEGSYPGWQQLQSGRADVALLTFLPGRPCRRRPTSACPWPTT